MPLYRYEALDRTGNKVVGAMQVTDEQSLTDRLVGMGYQHTRVEIAQRNLRPNRTLTGMGVPPAGGPSTASQPG